MHNKITEFHKKKNDIRFQISQKIEKVSERYLMSKAEDSKLAESLASDLLAVNREMLARLEKEPAADISDLVKRQVIIKTKMDMSKTDSDRLIIQELQQAGKTELAEIVKLYSTLKNHRKEIREQLFAIEDEIKKLEEKKQAVFAESLRLPQLEYFADNFQSLLGLYLSEAPAKHEFADACRAKLRSILSGA